MPKEIVHIKQFHGGVNDASEPTDISDNESQIADNCDFSTIGKVALSGDLKGTHDAATEPHTVTTPGSGLFAFRHDRDNAGANATSNYYATHDLNIVSVYDDNENDWLAITTNGVGAEDWSDASGNDVNFLFQDGVLRSSDAQLVAGNQRKWWGYINRKHFGADSNARVDDYAGMFSHNADLAAPTAGTCHLANDTAAQTGIMHMEANITGSDGEIPAANYRLAYSFLYDHHQESLLKEFSGSPLAITENQSFQVPNFSFHTLNSRIAGCRVYIQREDTTDDWILLVDIDLEKGWRLGTNDTFKNTFTGSADDVDLPLTSTNITKLGAEYYSDLNGHAFDEPIDCSYKTAVVVDGITYAGNVIQNGRKYPDKIIKSAIGSDTSDPLASASDVFPESNFLDITPNDGDEIVKLETFQDKVLVFKRQTLFIVNYSADRGDYIDATFPFMGVRNRAHSFPTSHGIVFMNDLGVHIWNGESMLTLTGKMPDTTMENRGFSTTAGANDTPKPRIRNSDLHGNDSNNNNNSGGNSAR